MKTRLAFVLTAVLLSGCATSPVIGPVSYMTSQGNQRAMIRRSAMQSQSLTPEHKARVFQLLSHSSSPNEIAVGIGVDVMELVRGGYTTTEVVKQLVGVGGDITIYTILYAAVKALADSGDSTSSRNNAVSVNGNYNNVTTSNTDSTNTTTDNSDNRDNSR